MEDKKDNKSIIQIKTLDILWENGNMWEKRKEQAFKKIKNISAKKSPASARIRSAKQWQHIQNKDALAS